MSLEISELRKVSPTMRYDSTFLETLLLTKSKKRHRQHSLSVKNNTQEICRKIIFEETAKNFKSYMYVIISFNRINFQFDFSTANENVKRMTVESAIMLMNIKMKYYHVSFPN
jgi:hypothetical protein